MIDAEQERNRGTAANRKPPSAAVSRSIDWYAEGQSRMVEIGDVQVFFRLWARRAAVPGSLSRCRRGRHSVLWTTGRKLMGMADAATRLSRCPHAESQ